MIEGLYSGASAMQVLMKQQEIISGNLMHVSTSGHRRTQAAIHQRFEETRPDVSIDLGPEIRDVEKDFQAGRMVNTERPLDVAIGGDGFFEFLVNGSRHLTRNGRLFRDPNDGTLINEEGFPIQGDSGNITIPTTAADREIRIAPDGTVSVQDRIVGKLKTVAFSNNRSLEPVGVATFVRGDESLEVESDTQLMQHTHELSNVQPVLELVAMIANARHYEAIQRATRALGESLREYIRQ